MEIKVRLSNCCLHIPARLASEVVSRKQREMIEALEGRMTAAEEDIENLGADVTRLYDNKADHSEVEAVDAKADAAAVLANEAKTSAAEAVGKADTAQTAADAVAAEVASLATEVGTKAEQSDLDALSDKVWKNVRGIAENAEELSQHAAELEQHENALSQHAAELGQHGNAISLLGSDIEQLDSDLEDTKKDLGEYKTATNSALEGLETEKADRSELPNLSEYAKKTDLPDVSDKADKADLAETDRRLDALWKLNRGISYDFQTDSAEAYSKDIPSGAKEADVLKFGGKSVVWNQMIKGRGVSAERGGVSFTVSDDKLSVVLNGTCVASTTYIFTDQYNTDFKTIIGHKYLLISGYAKYVYATANFMQMLSSDYSVNFGTLNSSPYSVFWTATDSVSMFCRIGIQEGVTYDNVVVTPMMFDLTQMFGTGNEPTTIEEFKKILANNQYEFSEPTIKHANVDSIEVRGRNLLDTSGAVPSVSNGISFTPVYDDYGNLLYVSGSGTSTGRAQFFLNNIEPLEDGYYTLGQGFVDSRYVVCTSFITWYDMDNAVHYIDISNASTGSRTAKIENCKNIKQVCCEVRQSGYTINDLRWYPILVKGQKAMPYSPSRFKQLPIPSAIRSLDGYGWSAGSVYNEVDFEGKKFVKRVGRIIFDGSQTFRKTANYGSVTSFDFDNSTIKPAYTLDARNAVCNKFESIVISTADKEGFGIHAYANVLQFQLLTSRLTSDTAEALREWCRLNPFTVLYELAEPVITDISDILDTIEVESGGSITFHQTALKLPVPNTEKYLIALNEVTS